MNLMDCIRNYIRSVEIRVPIFTDDIRKYVAERIPNVKNNVLNEYITRYAKSDPTFIRYQKGVYYKTAITPFGEAGINYKELIRRVYLSDGDEVFGYETGPSLMNRLGLTTQMPTCTYIATDNFRSVVTSGKDNILLVKPVIDITKENYRYLQLLDLLDNKMKINFEAENYREILREMVDRHCLSFELLLYYARYYKNNMLFANIAKITRGEKI